MLAANTVLRDKIFCQRSPGADDPVLVMDGRYKVLRGADYDQSGCIIPRDSVLQILDVIGRFPWATFPGLGEKYANSILGNTPLVELKEWLL